MAIPSVVSRLTGVAVSLLVWWFVSLKVETFLAIRWDFWYLGEVLGQFLSPVLGGLAAFAMYRTGLRDVRLNFVGVLMVLGEPIKILFGNGSHWVPFFCSLQTVPAPDQLLFMRMPGEVINAQDSNTIDFGVKGDGVPANSVDYLIFDAWLYLKASKPARMFEKAFLDSARMFFSLMVEAAAVHDAKSLYSDFAELPQPTDPSWKSRRDNLEQRLTAAEHDAGKPIFTRPSVTSLMEGAGQLATEVARFGIKISEVRTPNIRQNAAMQAATEAAAASVVARNAEIENQTTRTRNAKILIKELATESQVSPDLAAAYVAAEAGRKLDVKHYSFSGLGGVSPDAVGRLVSEVVEKGGNNG